jgi:hypothetical protein
MTPTTLQALRRLLFFSVPEAAEHIGGVTERSWRKWEDGDRAIPQDVIDRIGEMVAWRTRALAEAESAMTDARRAMRSASHDEGAAPTVTWYATPEAWARAEGKKAASMWRPHCSVVAELCARHGAVAVPTD